MKKIVIMGAGGWASEFLWAIQRINRVTPRFEIVGFCDSDPLKQSGNFRGYPLLGDLPTLRDTHLLGGFVCAIGGNERRKAVFAQMSARGIAPLTLVDPAAHVADDAVVAPGCYIGIGGIVSCGATLGEGVVVNYHATVGHDSIVGPFANLCPGAHLSGATKVGEGALIGTNACTIPGVSVGAWATVGAGATVMRDLPEQASVARISRGVVSPPAI